ncbi:hypothetical protein [Rubrivirga sp. IMCC43871]|uniref:hypothetical protein n=1 Tax=Rubrivirga sp. IMCC43871 TaxID=3391575 RepID=UPI0039902F00
MRALALCLLVAATATAQTPRPVVVAPGTSASPADSALVVVVLTDGTRFTGRIVTETAEVLTLDTGSARISVDTARIRSREPFDGRMVDGRPVRTDPNRTRLLFAPTGRAIPDGSGYVADYQVFFPFVATGVGGGVTLAGGISLFPTFEFQLVYAAPKITVAEGASGSFAIGGIGVVPVGSAVDGDVFGVGLLYGVGTLGPSESAVSVGAGYGFAFGSDSGDSDGGVGVVMVGGERQLSGSVKLLSENYLFLTPSTRTACLFEGPCTTTTETETTTMFSLGVRFFGEQLAADVAAFVIPELADEGVPFLPWLGFAYNF